MSLQDEAEKTTLEVVDSSALESMERASIDVQIATAKKYPRVLSTVKQNMLSFATLDEETAASCFFTLPGRKGGDGKPIQGPSIRMAEIAISTFQNLRAGARIISDDGKQITAQGVCHDLQNNVCISVEIKRRVTKANGQRYSDDMVVMTGNAACAIALRNATFKVVPLALIRPVYEAAKATAIGDAKTLVQRRGQAMDHFAKLGVPKEKVYAALSVKSLEDIGLEHLEVLQGFRTAIKDGEASIDDIFNPKPETPPARLDEVIGKPDDKKPEEKKEAAATAPTEKPTETKYTAEQRQVILKEVEGLLLDHAVGESKVMLYVHSQKLAKEGQDEISALDTSVLDALRAVIPTLKKGSK